MPPARVLLRGMRQGVVAGLPRRTVGVIIPRNKAERDGVTHSDGAGSQARKPPKNHVGAFLEPAHTALPLARRAVLRTMYYSQVNGGFRPVLAVYYVLSHVVHSTDDGTAKIAPDLR